MQAVFYGISAAVLGIIVLSSCKLTVKSISKFESPAIKANWLLGMFYIVAAFLILVTQREESLLFVLVGFIYMIVIAPPKWIKRPKTTSLFLLTTAGFFSIELGKLGDLAWFFIKAGAFVFESGLAIVHFLHFGVVNEHIWLTENQFVDAVAETMITPGPVVITVDFLSDISFPD